MRGTKEVMKSVRKRTVTASLTDPQANLSVIGVFQVVEDAVTAMLGELNADNITMRNRHNAAWVFVKNRIRRFKDLGWGQEFSTVCFLSSATPITANADVEIRDEKGELCACSRVELCALDLQTGRIRRFSSFGFDGAAAAEQGEVDLPFTRLDCEDLPEVAQVQVKYTNIDFTRHTNNIEYIRFMLDTYSVAELQDRPVREMEIVYVSQSFEGDLLSVRRGGTAGGDLFALQKEGRTVAKGEILF